MATATTTAARREALRKEATRRDRSVKEYTFVWEGLDRSNRQVRGELKAASETVVTTSLRRQGIRITKLKRQTFRGGKKITDKDITFFTRQLATMLKSGVPLLQSFDIVARGHGNARFSRLMLDIKSKIETGSSMSQAFREHPGHFDQLYCNLVAAGEASGTIDAILERLATYKEKILALKAKIKSAMFYPISVIVVAIVAFSRMPPMTGIFSISRSNVMRTGAERRYAVARPMMVPAMMAATSHHHCTTQSEMPITINVGAGRSAPKLVNTSLKAGTTNTMITQTTTIATTITEIG